MLIDSALFKTIDPVGFDRVCRIQDAVALLRQGRKARDARDIIRMRYRCSHATAWRIVQTARNVL